MQTSERFQYGHPQHCGHILNWSPNVHVSLLQAHTRQWPLWVYFAATRSECRNVNGAGFSSVQTLRSNRKFPTNLGASRSKKHFVLLQLTFSSITVHHIITLQLKTMKWYQNRTVNPLTHLNIPCLLSFWATVCKTVRPILSDRCLSCPISPVYLWRWCIVAKPLHWSRCNMACW